MSFKVQYGSDNVSLWTPAASASYTLSTGSIVAWIDAEHTESVVTATGDGTYNSGYNVVVTLADRFNGKTFGQPSADGRTHARYGATDTSASINSRRTVWFSEHVLNSVTYDVVLTASTGDWQGVLPAGEHSALQVRGLRTKKVRCSRWSLGRCARWKVAHLQGAD